MSRYLLEIGVEEIPSSYVANTKKELKEKFEKLLTDNEIKYSQVNVESTPRRFAIFLEDLEKDLSEKKISVKGPSVKIAYDENGKAKKPLEGFLKGQNASLDDVSIKEFKGEDYIYVEKTIKSKNLEEILSESVYELVKSISFPRSMRWAGKSIRWARPIRYFLSLLDDKILDFSAEDILVSNITKGHRALGSSNIIVDKIDDYERLLEENYVILKDEKRKDIILKGLNRLSSEVGGDYMKDSDLLDEVVNIVEYPTVLMGEIDKKYLQLPTEVVTTPMKDHQRYFPIIDENKKLLPYFCLVRNGDDSHSENVIEGNKKVLIARLEDAKFFYDIDRKKSLEEYVDDLKNLTFFEGLGNMKQKTQRVMELAERYRKALEIGDDTKEDVKRAALLSKADLVTKMVIEFTELEGVMGKIYALEDNEEARVAEAIREAYLPKSQNDDLPKTIIGIILSIADKMDTIVGLYSIEKYVTGSQDPFALRRQTLGIINIFLENGIDLDIKTLINDALLVYTEKNELSFDYDLTMEKVVEFFKERLKHKLIDEGYRYDYVNSVINTQESNLLRIYKKVKAIDTTLKDDNEAISYFLRILNLSKETRAVEIDENLFENDLEKQYYQQIKNLDEIDFEKSSDYESQLQALINTKDIGNQYFDQTMINVEDEKIKSNRLLLIGKIKDKITSILDTNELVKD